MREQIELNQRELEGFKKREGDAEKAKAQHVEDIKNFETNAKPVIVEKHADFDQIVKSPGGEFFKWAEQQPPVIQFAAFNSSDPQDMIIALDRFKADKASGYLAIAKTKDQDHRKTKLENARSLQGGVTIPDTIEMSSERKANDYDAGFEEAGKILERQGVA
jgi:hypothetical protein